MDRGQVMDTGGGAWIPLEDPKAKGPLTGIWLSRYEYESSSRGGMFADAHYVVIIQHGARLLVRSVPASASRLMMDLTASGQVATGTWTEQTSTAGYYQGGVYHGAIQFLLDPTGRRMAGRWVGFGRDFDLNSGPWTLELVSADTGKAAMGTYNRVRSRPPARESAPSVDDRRCPLWSADKAEGMTRGVGVNIVTVELRRAERNDARARGGRILHHDVEMKLLRDGGVRPRGPAVPGRELEGKTGRGIVRGHDDPVLASVGNGLPQQFRVELGQ